MNQKHIHPSLEVNCCPFKHNNLCSKKWSAKFINHAIICNCECHRKLVLGKEVRDNNSSSEKNWKEFDYKGEFNT
jgi:hypothetical protein